MSSMEVNKAVAAVLMAGVAFLGSQLIADAVVKPKALHQTAIKIDLPQPGGAAVATAKAEPEQPIEALLVSADAGRGEAGVKAQGCVSCHSFNEGGKAGVGPNLYGVMGAPHGHMEGYTYSAALKGKQGPWTFAEMNSWLIKPSAYAPGTKMSYAGLTDNKKRADIIAYLRSLSHDPLPLPAAPAQTAGAAPAAAPQQVAAVQSVAPAGPAPAAPPPAVPAAATGNDSVVLLASASPDAGKADTAKLGCVACHSFNEGGRNGLGPNLYGVVGAEQGAHAQGYAYSAALKGKGGKWDFAELDKWLLKPSAYAPGTKMSYAGISDPKVRADVISYLRSLSAEPLPLPN
jgi:cytochrome c